MSKPKQRCHWAGTDAIYQRYHDEEWGRPVHDDRHLFEMLCLEGAQAGLSWLTILKRRDNYRLAFDNFEADKIVTYDEAKRAELLQNEGIIRNRLKIDGVIKNAKAYLAVKNEFGSFDTYIWRFADRSKAEAMSKDLERRGFSFVGPTICYAFMQAVGMVNDHEPECYLAPTNLSHSQPA